jgi:ABC-2 type transport system permease protein
MIAAVFKTMWLRLWRDKGALILAFILPGFIFAVFASIFSNAAGGNLDIRVAMAVTSDDPAVIDFAQDLRSKADYSVTFKSEFSEDDIRERIALGTEDVGVIITARPALGAETPPFKIITEPSRDVAATILQGQIRQYIASQSASGSRSGLGGNLFDVKSAITAASQNGPKDPSVTYYVGGVAILFLLFSAMQGAALTLEERESGISRRILPGPKNVMKLIFGKYLFLTFIGTLQTALILLVAALFFDVVMSGHLAGLIFACLGAASLAASIGLLTASLCRTPAQMNTVSTFIVLLCSAVGGSMVPRFMMPDWLQGLGRFTPNHWAIEAMYGILARGQTLSDLLVTWLILFGCSAAAICLTIMISHKLRRL